MDNTVQTWMPVKIVELDESFHDGMKARVVSNGSASFSFLVNNVAKHGCALALTYSAYRFFCMLNDTFKDLHSGIWIQF